ncbi:MAG: hypothetical protein K2X47_17305 [Bdellovibrionales bacterium]|nr:hypothetical protein [Bdellovibrionales bacterium]
MGLWLGTILAVIGSIVFHAGKEERAFIKKSVMIHPPAYLEHMTLGFDDIVADTLWIRLIQDYDLCEASNVNILGGAVGKKCSEGWIFRMVDAITNLSPKFRMPYATGGTILSVIIEDFAGAAKVFAKAENQFPNDYVFPYRAAYNYMYGLSQPLEASEALLRASKLEGAPSWLPLLAARQAKQGGKLELGVRILEDLVGERPEWEQNPRLQELRKELARIQKAEATIEEPERAPTGGKAKASVNSKSTKSAQ